MSKHIPIDIYWDVLCPYSYIGKRNLKLAISTFRSHHPSIDISVTYLPFYLKPDMHSTGYDKSSMYTLNPTQEATLMRIQAATRAVGINLNPHGTCGNSRPAHILATSVLHIPPNVDSTMEPTDANDLPDPLVVQDYIVTELFKGHFQTGQDISDTNFLGRLALESGLVRLFPKFHANEQDDTGALFVQNMLADEQLVSAVDAAACWAQANSGGKFLAIPSFTVAERYRIGGFQEPEVFITLFERIVTNQGWVAPTNVPIKMEKDDEVWESIEEA